MYNVVAAKLTKTILLNEKQNYGGYFSISIHTNIIPYSTIFTVALTQSKKKRVVFCSGFATCNTKLFIYLQIPAYLKTIYINIYSI